VVEQCDDAERLNGGIEAHPWRTFREHRSWVRGRKPSHASLCYLNRATESHENTCAPPHQPLRILTTRRPPVARQVRISHATDQTFESVPDRIRSTSTFHSSLVSTARLPASPTRTCSPANSTSAHSPHPAGHRSTCRLSNVFTSFLSRFSAARCDDRRRPCRVVERLKTI